MKQDNGQDDDDELVTVVTYIPGLTQLHSRTLEQLLHSTLLVREGDPRQLVVAFPKNPELSRCPGESKALPKKASSVLVEHLATAFPVPKSSELSLCSRLWMPCPSAPESTQLNSPLTALASPKKSGTATPHSVDCGTRSSDPKSGVVLLGTATPNNSVLVEHLPKKSADHSAECSVEQLVEACIVENPTLVENPTPTPCVDDKTSPPPNVDDKTTLVVNPIPTNVDENPIPRATPTPTLTILDATEPKNIKRNKTKAKPKKTASKKSEVASSKASTTQTSACVEHKRILQETKRDNPTQPKKAPPAAKAIKTSIYDATLGYLRAMIDYGKSNLGKRHWTERCAKALSLSFDNRGEDSGLFASFFLWWPCRLATIQQESTPTISSIFLDICRIVANGPFWVSSWIRCSSSGQIHRKLFEEPPIAMWVNAEDPTTTYCKLCFARVFPHFPHTPECCKVRQDAILEMKEWAPILPIFGGYNCRHCTIIGHETPNSDQKSSVSEQRFTACGQDVCLAQRECFVRSTVCKHIETLRKSIVVNEQQQCLKPILRKTLVKIHNEMKSKNLKALPSWWLV